MLWEGAAPGLENTFWAILVVGTLDWESENDLTWTQTLTPCEIPKITQQGNPHVPAEKLPTKKWKVEKDQL